MLRVCLWAAAFVLLGAPGGAAVAEKRVALVIGNSAYEAVTRLRNPANDATALAERLEKAGFDQVTLELDLDYSALRKTLGRFSRTAADAEIALVYFAGHGIEAGGVNYLIPTDATLGHVDDIEFEAVPLRTAISALNRASGLKLVILDACRNNPFVPHMDVEGADRSIGRGLSRVTPRGGDTLVAYAAREGTVAADGEGDHSPYATALLKHIATPDVDVRLVFGRVRDDVLAATKGRQEPFTYGSLGGDQIFLANAGSAEVVGDEAADMWAAIQNSTVAADFAAFIDRYPDSFLAGLAVSRLEDLSSTEVAALAPTDAVATPAEKQTACFVYVGSSSDNGWSQAHDEGRRMVERVLGDRVETRFAEAIPEGPEGEKTIREFADNGCNIVFGTSFGYMDGIAKAAKQFPGVKFEHATGFKTADNVSTYNVRTYEARYVAGQIAARVSKTGMAGYVASFPIPEVISSINAFMLGAQSVEPDFRVRIGWANTWFDPAKESELTGALIQQGADVIVQHTDSPAPLQVAEAQGVRGFGQIRDRSDVAPNAQLTGSSDNWGAYYVKRVRAVLDGTWRAGGAYEGLAEGIITMIPYANLPEGVVAMARRTEDRIKSGDLHPFAGPVVKQNGDLAVAAGSVLGDNEILGMNWLVRGIDGKLPN